MRGIGRVFVAVVPPVAVLDAVEAAVARLAPSQPAARWVPRGQWHVTVQFLGRVADVDELVGALCGALEQSLRFSLRLGGAGAFPNSRRATVAWVGVDDGREALGCAAAVVHAATEVLGFPTEPRSFRPHVTVARLARPGPVDTIVAGLTAVDLGPAWTVEEIVVFESRTRPSGAEHHEQARIPLAAARHQGTVGSDR